MATQNYSRTDLLNWVNGLLQLQVTKIESCGSGAVYCQIIDSLTYDVPMSKVNFEAKTPAQYISNFKILQEAMKRNGIPLVADVSELIKCKMMANLAFLQALRQYWDTHHTSIDYDALGRRSARSGSAAQVRTSGGSGAVAGGANGSARRRAPLMGRPESALNSLQKQNEELQGVVVGLERERDFYFSKLRDIELLFQEREGQEEGKSEDPILAQIQAILYSTEDGFEIPQQEGMEDFGVQPGEMVEETF